MDISVVIPSYNSKRTIEACLSAVCSQSTKLKYEVIVVDSSDDGTHKSIASFPVTLIRSQKRLFAGEARNRGIKRAKGRIIAFTDADCVVSPNWLDELYAAHKKYDAVGGRIANGNPKNLLGWSLFLPQFAEFSVLQDRFVKNMPTCNVSYKKGLFSKYGFFPDVFSHEEYFFNVRLNEPIFFSKNVVASHINRTNFFEIVRHDFQGGQGAAFSRRMTGDNAFLFKWKVLIPLLFLYRFCKTGMNAVRSGYGGIFTLTSPFILINCIAWNLGFLNWTMKNLN